MSQDTGPVMSRNMSPGTSMRATIPQNRPRESAPSMTIPHIAGRHTVVYRIPAAADVLDRKRTTHEEYGTRSENIWRRHGDNADPACSGELSELSVTGGSTKPG